MPSLSRARASSAIRSIRFSQLRVDAVTLAQALDGVSQMVGRGGGTVFTPNVHHVALARHDASFAQAYARAGLCLCDGKPLQWAAAPLGGLPARIAGSVFLPELLRYGAQRRWRVFFVGGREGVAARLPTLLMSTYPGLVLAGISPPTRALVAAPSMLEPLAAAIAASRATLTLVSLPSPLQEVWADAAWALEPGPVFVCTGSAIDRLVGLAAQAPRYLGNLGLEWAWRIGQEPGRLGPRYAADAAAFVPEILGTWGRALRQRFRARR